MMRNIILSLLLLFSTMTIASCAEQDAVVEPAKTEAAQEVYLAPEALSVSSFDATPNWAPLPMAEAAIDGNLLTRWSSTYADEQWISFDFGRAKAVSKVVIFWEAAYAVDYDILASLDNQNWQLISAQKDSDGGIDKIEFTPANARYIKLLGKKRANQKWGISLWEFLALGPDSQNPGDKPLSLVYPQLVSQLDSTEVVLPELTSEPPEVSPGALTLDELQQGVVYTSWSRNELGSNASDETIEHLRKLGVRYLGVMVIWLQDTIEEEQILPDPQDTAEDKALVHAINQAHSLGMKVMLKPHVDIKSGQWRGEIIPSVNWFASYKKFILHYAQLAAQYNVESFSIGTELTNTTIPCWQAQWDEIIKEVKQSFSGRLTYSANWDEYKTVDFWPQLDFIGIDSYFPLTAKKNATKEELIAAWKGHAQDIDGWLAQKKLDKPVVFTEIGYCSADGTNTQPWTDFSNVSEAVVDQEEQISCLEAMLAACPDYPWFKGFYWWNYFPREVWSPLGYPIRSKEAEEIFANWLKKTKR